MGVPELSIVPEPGFASDADVIVLGASVREGSIELVAEPGFADLVSELEDVGFTGRPDEFVRLPRRSGKARIAVVSVAAERTVDDLRYAAGSAARQLTSFRSAAFALGVDDAAEVEAVLEGAALGSYRIHSYRQAASSSPVLSRIAVHARLVDPDPIVAHVAAVADAVFLVKDLVNTPANDLHPERFTELASDQATALGIVASVWNVDRLEQDGFGGILGVGRGSQRPPRLVKLSYSPEGAQHHLALVGKGITFDSGGLSMKTPAGMIGMKYDMTGAATVLGVITAAARLRLPVRITGWLCLAENMPSGTAMRPGDVITIRGGRTVEVLNTDAEGRLVLADGLVAASEESPDAIVDVATLTGAAAIALGTRYAAVMGADSLVGKVLAAAKSAGELLWPMPLPTELRATLQSDVADIANANPGSTAGGMLLAGVFLQEFVGTRNDGSESEPIPWAHLDIAGPAKSPGSAFGFTGKGGTGVTVRALLRLAEDISRQ